jgi:hypothetical protein
MNIESNYFEKNDDARRMAEWRKRVQEGKNVRSILKGVLPSNTSGNSSLTKEPRFLLRADREEIREKHRRALQNRQRVGIESKAG